MDVSEKAIDMKRRRLGLFMGVDPFVGQTGIRRTEQRDSNLALQVKRLSFVTEALGWRDERFVTEERCCGYAFMPDDSRCQYLVKIWSGRRDSNPQPSAWEADALPLRHTRSRRGEKQKDEVLNKKIYITCNGFSGPKR